METYWLLGKDGLFDISKGIAEDGICIVHRTNTSTSRRTFNEPDEETASIIPLKSDSLGSSNLGDED